jgi:hypothetical protein
VNVPHVAYPVCARTCSSVALSRTGLDGLQEAMTKDRALRLHFGVGRETFSKSEAGRDFVSISIP